MGTDNAKKICIVGASGKLGQYMVRHALERGYEVVGVCRERSVPKLAAFEGRITIVPGPTNDPGVIKRAVAGCDGVLTVLVPWGVRQYSSGTAQAVLDHARPGARLIFSCGWHITRDGKDAYSRMFPRGPRRLRRAGQAGPRRRDRRPGGGVRPRVRRRHRVDRGARQHSQGGRE
ncbi:NAD(P)H-binding protein [Streptomyces sp. NPDC058665]|uniref:NAD(P)H-binding protein n=1 Tax=Streptomyces sp. NPDC058665 TaxID=3346586 RepID=UPI0036634BB8